eukprot:s5178_g4.t1
MTWPLDVQKQHSESVAPHALANDGWCFCSIDVTNGSTGVSMAPSPARAALCTAEWLETALGSQASHGAARYHNLEDYIASSESRVYRQFPRFYALLFLLYERLRKVERLRKRR